jgi:hypothetical protein
MTTLKEVCALVASMWPHPPWDPQVQVLFAEALAGEAPANLLAAVLHFYQTDPKGYRPTPGQILALIEMPDPEAPERAWRAFRRAVDHYAGKPTQETPDMPSFADPKCAQAVHALGGFRQFLSGIQAKEADWLHSKFLRAYAAAGRAPLALPEHRAERLPEGRKSMEQAVRLASADLERIRRIQ